MRNNKKRGFTLVELLVVIAILAILATVSVVGYTSFIQRASISNDENVAAQLNKFLVAVKADSTGPFYNEEINEDNIWEVTDYILTESGLNDLEPQAGKHGYHFYYDLEKGEYVVLHNDKAVDSESALDKLIRFTLSVFAEDEPAETPTYKVSAGNCFTKGYQFFLVDTKGDLADVITGYYSFENLTGDTTEEKFAIYTAKVESIGVTPIINLVNETVFVTAEGNFVTNLSGTHNKLVFHEGATFISNFLKDGDATTPDVALGGTNYLLSFDEDAIVEIPAGIMLPTNSLHISVANNAKVVVKLNGSGWNELEQIVDASFTSTGVVVSLNDEEYVVRDYLVNWNTEELRENTVESLAAAILGSNFPLTDFDLGIVLEEKKVVNNLLESGDPANTGFVALDIVNGINFEFLNVNEESGKPASKPDVTWEIVSLKVKNVPVDNVGDYIIHTGNKITFVKDANGFLPEVDQIVVKATSNNTYVDENGETKAAEKEFTIDVVRVTAVVVKIDNDNLTVDSMGRLVCENNSTGLTTFDFDINVSTNFTVEGIELSDTVAFEYACEHTCTEECCAHTHTIADCGMTCTHTCEKFDDCWECFHECSEWGYYSCMYVKDPTKHTDACRSGVCPHISGGDHGGADSACIKCTHTHTDGSWSGWGYSHNCYKNCAHSCVTDHETDGCTLTCTHTPENCDCYSNCDHSHGLGCMFGCNHTHTDSCVGDCKHSHSDDCYTCHHTHVEGTSCTSNCNHTKHDDSCYGNCKHKKHTEACVNTNICDHVTGGAHSKGHEGSCCTHKCSDKVNGETYVCLECSHKCNLLDECGKCNHVCTNACTYKCEHNKLVFTQDTNNDDIIIADGGCTGTLTVQVGDYQTQVLDLEVYDSFEIEANTNITILGRGTNSILVSDLFKGDIPEGATLEIFYGYPSNNYMEMPTQFVEAPNIIEGFDPDDYDFYVNANHVLVNANLSNEITFTAASNADSGLVSFALYNDGVRISESVTVKVVVGKNVREYRDLNRDGTLSNILLDDIKMPKDNTTDTFTIPAGKTFYGNGHTFDITNGRLNGAGIITLSGTLRDTRVIGAIYEILELSGNNPYGSNAICALNGAVIENCYIANCRAPLWVGTENQDGLVTIKDSIIFGGRYANIDFRGGELKLEGDVILINQPYKGVVGTGINVWLRSAASGVAQPELNITSGCNFKQYNFLTANDAGILPVVPVEYSGMSVNVDLPSLVKSIFGVCIKNHDHGNGKNCCNNASLIHTSLGHLGCSIDMTTYAPYVLTHNGVQYANVGVFSLNNAYTQFTNGVPEGYGQLPYAYVDILGITYYMYVTSPVKDYVGEAVYHVDADNDGVCDHDKCTVETGHTIVEEGEGEAKVTKCSSCGVEITDDNRDTICGTPYVHADANSDGVCDNELCKVTITDDNKNDMCVCHMYTPIDDMLVESIGAQYRYCFEDCTDESGKSWTAYGFDRNGKIIH